jgi:lipooligosaccharide transport system permease protein
VNGLFRPAGRVLLRRLTVYRRTWRGTLFFSFLSPVLFLAAMGLGLGGFVDRSAAAALGGVSYLVFLAPGLLAANAMQTATIESTFPVMAGVRWQKHYQGMLATPLGVRDIVAGELGFVALRLLLVSGVFLAVMTAFGAVQSPLALAAMPAAVLTGLAFAAPIMAYSATQDNDNGFSVLFRFVITPLFLFSGTFFPIERLPDLLRPVAYVTPLWHGVALTRSLTLGTLDPLQGALHVAVLVALFSAGTVACLITFRRRLVK